MRLSTWRRRVAGLSLLGGAGGSSLVHRHVLASAATHPASVLEMGLAFATFILASAGLVLIAGNPGPRD